MQTMHIEIEESAKAFRINGVTFAKRHLINTMTKPDDDLEKKLARFLVIVPFLATSFTPAEGASDSIKYGAIKAKRLYKALGLNEDNAMPFMLVCMQQAGADLKGIGAEVRKAGFYENGKVNFSTLPFQTGEQEQQADPFPKKKPTLH